LSQLAQNKPSCSISGSCHHKMPSLLEQSSNIEIWPNNASSCCNFVCT
jgi:hypothetical protein